MIDSWLASIAAAGPAGVEQWRLAFAACRPSALNLAGQHYCNRNTNLGGRWHFEIYLVFSVTCGRG
jgi:hypothetical protein